MIFFVREGGGVPVFLFLFLPFSFSCCYMHFCDIPCTISTGNVQKHQKRHMTLKLAGPQLDLGSQLPLREYKIPPPLRKSWKITQKSQFGPPRACPENYQKTLINYMSSNFHSFLGFFGAIFRTVPGWARVQIWVIFQDFRGGGILYYLRRNWDLKIRRIIWRSLVSERLNTFFWLARTVACHRGRLGALRAQSGKNSRKWVRRASPPRAARKSKTESKKSQNTPVFNYCVIIRKI